MSNNSQLILMIIKLVFGGISSLFSILLLSKTRDFSILSLVIAALSMYAVFIYEILIHLGIVLVQDYLIFGIPILLLFFTLTSSIFFLIAIILIFCKLNN